jgi:hypothetical protein
MEKVYTICRTRRAEVIAPSPTPAKPRDRVKTIGATQSVSRVRIKRAR